MPALAAGALLVGAFAAATATAVLLTATINAATFVVAQFFQEAQGRSPLGAGLLLLPWHSPRSSSRRSRACSRTGWGIAGCSPPGCSHGASAWGRSPCSLAPGPVTPRSPPRCLWQASASRPRCRRQRAPPLGPVPPADLGRASGATATLQRLGGSLGVALAAAAFTAHGSGTTPETFVAGFHPALVIAAALSMVGALTAMALPSVTTGRRNAVNGPGHAMDGRPLTLSSGA
jgi:hypothetical protein